MNYTELKITSGGRSVTFTPAAIKPQYESLSKENSGRDANGDMHIEWIRKNSNPCAVPAFEITLPPHSIHDPLYQTILSLVQGQEYTMKYYDYLAAAWKTLTFYTASSSLDWYHGIILNGIVSGETFKATCTTNVEYPRRSTTQLSAPVITLSGTTVSWSAVSHANGYEIVDSAIGTITQSGTSYSLIGAQARTIVVRATSTSSSYTTSPNSNAVTYTPAVAHLVSLISADPTQGGTNGSGSYVQGQTVTALATPETGFAFGGWYDSASGGSLVSSDNPYTFTAGNADVTLYARFTVSVTYTVTITVPSGVSYVLDGTTYTGTRSFSYSAYPTARLLNLKPSNQNNYPPLHLLVNDVITHYSIDDGFSAWVDHNMAIEIVYNSQAAHKRIYVNVQGEGSVFVGGNDAGIQAFPATIYAAITDTVTLTAEEDAEFSKWKRDGADYSTSRTISLPVTTHESSTFVAVFD